ncbi:hypothetical protein JZ751_025594 [Albula glossodonta]|uniref:Coiled-coil protein 142 C-terminal domain-containing protein n=1 Tax=Albula glossodonta TaxID=121402 RepID=A0A8T2NLS5_9TELE|nr:hypothetical protein JZ751_025594 [Albula glossodonta]
MAQMPQASSGSLPPLRIPGNQRRVSSLDADESPERPEVRMEVWPADDTAGSSVLEEDQKRTYVWPETSCEDRSEVPCIQRSFSRSLQKAEALLRTRLNPGLRWLLKQKSDDCSDPESEDTFVACQNLTSRSSRRLQRLEQCMLGLSRQCQVLHEPTGVPQGLVRGPSPDDCEFYHHPASAAFGRHYAHLQNLLEDRAQLLFLHEYARRHRASAAFVANLSSLLERERASLGAGWGYGVGALCEELRVHLGHWAQLRAKARADRWLRPASFWSSRTAAAAHRSLTLLGQQALALTEEYLHVCLSSLPKAYPDGVPAEALEDMLAGVEAFNHVVAEQGTHLRATGRRARGGPVPFPATRLLQVLAEHRGRVAAETLHRWVASQNRPLPTLHTDPQRFWWEQVRWPDLLVSLTPLGGAPTVPSTPCPLASLLKQDTEFTDRLFQALLLSTDLLVSHVPSRPMRDRPHTADGSPAHPQGGCDGHDSQETKRCKSVQWRDSGKSNACTTLAARYKHVLWKEFGRAFLVLLYHPPQNCILGSLNQCSNQMVLHLVAELHSACRTVLHPVECDGLLNDLCTQVVAKTALSHWDEVLCASLGTGLKDKCLPDMEGGDIAIQTPTAELLLQLYPSLHTSLSCLEPAVRESAFDVLTSVCPLPGLGQSFILFPGSLWQQDEPRKRARPHVILNSVLRCVLKATSKAVPPPPSPSPLPQGSGGGAGGGGELWDPRTLRSFRVSLLGRAVVTVHTATFWVMSKAYQFLCSWALNKFLLVTLGDLKVLKAAADRLAVNVQALGVERGEVLSPVEWQIAQLTRGVADLQVFSELVLRIFSKDCKKMAVEIFEQTMPSGKHWRVTCKAEPQRPTQSTVHCTTVQHTVTAPHCGLHLQGALQLKQDFDLIRDLIRSEEYRLSEEIHQRLLSLRVFHQVDSAIVCLLQQPVAKSYIPSRGWEPFRRCCPNNTSLVDPGSGSLNSLESMDIQAARNQALTEAEESLSPRVLATSPPESYLAISQQEWLALRIHNGTRWKLPGLHCLNKSEH